MTSLAILDPHPLRSWRKYGCLWSSSESYGPDKLEHLATLHTALGRTHPAQAAWDAWPLTHSRSRDRECERERSDSA